MGLTFLLMLIEAAGGWWSGSLALLSDAAHMFTDVGALLLTWTTLWIASLPASSRMSFGYHRAEVLGALFSGLSIWLLTGMLVYEAILRLQAPPQVQGATVLVIAAAGFAVNLITLFVLKGERHEHLSVQGAYLHVLTDLLGSVAALISGVVLTWTDFRLIDPIVTLVISALLLHHSWPLIREAASVLMNSTPAHLNSDEIRQALGQVPHVRGVHDLHIWTVASGRAALSVHLLAEAPETVLPESILNAANHMLEDRFEIRHTTIQIERPGAFDLERCYDCEPQKPRQA